MTQVFQASLDKERMVLNAMDLGGGWTSIATIRRRTDLGPNVLLRALARLEAKGKSERSPLQPATRDGRGRTLFYRRKM